MLVSCPCFLLLALALSCSCLLLLPLSFRGLSEEIKLYPFG
jgi:hypothetical protein